MKNKIEEMEPEELLNDLQKRVDSLESSTYVNSDNVELLLEIIKILSEMPVGKRLLNRAINRKRLEKLEQVILPRRRNDLSEIMNMNMPVGVLEDFSNKEMKLINKTVRHIKHRQNFENKSAEYLKQIIEKFFKKIDKSMKSINIIPSIGGKNA